MIPADANPLLAVERWAAALRRAGYRVVTESWQHVVAPRERRGERSEGR